MDIYKIALIIENTFLFIITCYIIIFLNKGTKKVINTTTNIDDIINKLEDQMNEGQHIMTMISSPQMESCSSTRHVFKETNYTFRKGISVTCQCGNTKLRMFAYQDITRDHDPLIIQEFEVKTQE